MILSWVLSLALCKTCASPPGVEFIPREALYLPVLRTEIENNWPSVPARSVFAAQVQQETCSSMRSTKCWSPTAELKTGREYGFGLGQITVTSKFDNFKEAKKLHPTLTTWEWENRYNPQFQLRTMILMDRFNFEKLSWAENDHERLAFMFASYNGGLGGVLSDRSVCRSVPGCRDGRWFGHVERHSRKAKVAANGYGKSFFEINREYVANVMGPRRSRYYKYFGE